MGKPRIKWNLMAFAELRNEPGVLADLQDRADSVASRAGAGYESRAAEAGKGMAGRGRAIAITGDFAAILDNARNNTLLRALGGTENASRKPEKFSYTTKAGKTIQATQAQIDNWTRNRR